MAYRSIISTSKKLPHIDHFEGHVMRAWIDNGALTVTSVGAENVYARNEFGMEFYAKDVPDMESLRADQV